MQEETKTIFDSEKEISDRDWKKVKIRFEKR